MLCSKRHLCFHLRRHGAMSVKREIRQVGSNPWSKSVVFCGKSEWKGQGLITWCGRRSSLRTKEGGNEAGSLGEANVPLCFCRPTWLTSRGCCASSTRSGRQQWKRSTSASEFPHFTTFISWTVLGSPASLHTVCTAALRAVELIVALTGRYCWRNSLLQSRDTDDSLKTNNSSKMTHTQC